jgi:hypothetical protein
MMLYIFGQLRWHAAASAQTTPWETLGWASRMSSLTKVSSLGQSRIVALPPREECFFPDISRRDASSPRPNQQATGSPGRGISLSILMAADGANRGVFGVDYLGELSAAQRRQPGGGRWDGAAHSSRSAWR